MILLVGAGTMAKDYSKVLQSLSYPFIAVCRSKDSAIRFENTTGAKCFYGGVSNIPAKVIKNITSAIIAVPVDLLEETCIEIMGIGVSNVLIEKPGALYLDGLENIAQVSKDTNTNIKIGYNRRFYSSVCVAKKYIEEDGGVSNFHFELTEWGHVISEIESISDIVKENWFIANTTHLVDLAFYLCGKPKSLYSNVKGTTSWHSRGSIFSGAGISTENAHFTYYGNWESAGRFKLEINTANNKLIFSPIETLKIIERGSVKEKEVYLNSTYDNKFKPGLYEQVKVFIENPEDSSFCSLEEQINLFPIYYSMAGY